MSCPKTEPGFPMPYVVVFFCVQLLRWETIVHFVDIGGIVINRHCLTFLFIIYRSEWLLFNANSAIFQLYHGENKLWMRWWWGLFVLDQHAELDFYSASSLKQQSADKHVAPLGHIILIPNQPVFVLFLNAGCLA